MKKILFWTALCACTMASAQGFRGKHDQKLGIGMFFQDGGSGIHSTFDYGLAENISIGAASSYILNVYRNADLRFEDRFDLRMRLNAHLGSVLRLDRNMDVYPGLHLGLRSFGGHAGARYFFSRGFGLYSEMSVPLARYKGNADGAELLNNQFMFFVGASFSF